MMRTTQRLFRRAFDPSSWAKRVLRGILGRRLPVHHGQMIVAGLRQSIVIRRDRWGIPHIEANHDDDAWFGLGFCQGQDRAFQLETILRLARGTFAELVGPRGLPIDRLIRRLGLAQSAKQQWSVLSPEVQAILCAFVAGVNQGHSVGLPARPHEMALLQGQLTPWQPEDVLAFVKLQSFILPSNWDLELARWQMLTRDGESALRSLDPAIHQMESEFAALRELLPAWQASNNWALAPRRTLTGRPIVANDPHLAPALPSPWYLAHIETPSWSVAGAVFAGSPGFAAGFNGYLAWGATAALIDNADWFIEEFNEQGDHVRDGDGWAKVTIRNEVIKIRGQPDVVEQVRCTPRGPVVSPVFRGHWPALSLRAVWLDALPTAGFLTAVRAQSIDEFRQHFAHWPCLPLNLVFADTAGNIGYQMVGNVPQRRNGSGMLPKPGDKPEFAWDGWVPYEWMPCDFNPSSGYLVTANNAPKGHETNSPLGRDWMDPFRYRSICEKIETRYDWTVEACQKLQMDVRSLPWELVRDVVIQAAETAPDLQNVAGELRRWDGHLSADSPVAGLVAVLMARLMVRTARAKAPRSYEWLLGRTAWDPAINLFYLRRMQPVVELLQKQPPGWFDRPWSEVIVEELRHAARSCRFRPWGRLHRLRPKSLIFGDVPVLRFVFSLGPIPVGGDTDTINQASVRPTQPIGETDNVAGMRMVVDVGNWSSSRFSVCGGQVGNPCSPHYGDLFEYWRRGDGVPMAWTMVEVRAATRNTLQLDPVPIPSVSSSETAAKRG